LKRVLSVKVAYRDYVQPQNGSVFVRGTVGAVLLSDGERKINSRVLCL